MNKTKISAKVVADSVDVRGNRLTSLLITFPRIILAEINTHRMLSKNTSSSRAIPFHKMVESVQNDPFVPIAWQKEHKGMQGSKYYNKELVKDLKHHNWHYEGETKVVEQLRIEWLQARDEAVNQATYLNELGLTKQLCNRLLEPFMWTTMLITSSKEGWDNFFSLRCPSYSISNLIDGDNRVFKSKKDFLKELDYEPIYPDSDLDWLKINKGQAEIHMMALAESIYDVMNESTPEQLNAGEWHIPFEDKIHKVDTSIFSKPEFVNPVFDMIRVKISTAMAARTSYTVVGEEKGIDYSKMIELHDRLIAQSPPHSSPLEHCCLCVTENEYNNSFKGQEKGWFRNYKGFKSYRQVIEESK